MNTHDKIELPPLPDSIFISDHQGDGEYFEAEDMQDYARAAIEADRKRRGEPDAVAACHAVRPYIDSIVCYASTMDEHDGNRVAKMVEDVCAAHPQPAEPSDSLPRHVAQTLATAIYETAQKMGIANGDHSALSVPQCLHLLDCMAQPAEPVSVPKHLIERLQKHCEDKSNTAFARSTMREALQYLTAEFCASLMSDKTACGSENGDCDSQPAEPDKQHPDDVAVDAFAAAMKAKLAKKRDEGRGGWRMCGAGYLSRLLREHVEKGDPVDVANLAMMLHQNAQGITPAEPVAESERVYLHDEGHPEYLDGARCQYFIERGKPYPHGDPVAFVYEKEDAEKIVAALNAQPAEPAKVPPGYVLIAEDYLEAMIGPERMDHLRRSCRFPAP